MIPTNVHKVLNPEILQTTTNLYRKVGSVSGRGYQHRFLIWEHSQVRSLIRTEENIGPDPHAPGSELPASAYAADVGYLVDGTPIDKAGNNTVH